jgi:hypothetical protein
MQRAADRAPRRMRKGMYIVPSLFTTANIAFGYYAILQITHATVADFWHFDSSAKAIGFAVMFDGLWRRSCLAGMDVGISPASPQLGRVV